MRQSRFAPITRASIPLRQTARKLCLGLGCAWLMACASLPVVDSPSVNQNERIQFLVLHFTSLPFDESMRRLTERSDRPVSAHYVVPEPGDATYGPAELKIHRLVAEGKRAWHAGVSSWRGQASLNASSIGIELVNQSHCESREPGAEPQTPEMQSCLFLDFADEQIELLIELVRGILERHPDIDPVDIIAHSDVAPDRRLDPGPTFPWKRLYDNGIGAWYDDSAASKYRRLLAEEPPTFELLQRALRAYGYDVEPTGQNDLQTRFAVRAFQLHFRPALADGVFDTETSAILFALLEKYQPRKLAQLSKY